MRETGVRQGDDSRGGSEADVKGPCQRYRCCEVDVWDLAINCTSGRMTETDRATQVN